MMKGDALRLLKHVQVETSSWCNRSCTFCPNSTHPTHSKTLMPLEIYRKLLFQLNEIQFSGRFSPYLRNEPLLDKRLPQLIEEARAALPGAHIFLNSNGDALTERRALELFSSGLDTLMLNAYDEHRLLHLKALLPLIQQKLPDLLISPPNFNMLIRRLPGRNRIALLDATEWKIVELTNRAGNVVGAAVPVEPLRRDCFRPTEQLYVTVDGDVVLCCCDWKGEVIFGNLQRESLAVAFNSPMAREYRQRLSNLDRSLPLCNVCDFPGSYGRIENASLHA